MTVSSFAGLGLAEPLMRALKDAQYDQPTPIQSRAIPPLLEGADLLGIAQTGTGKTAAFTLPLLQNLAEDGADGVRAEPRSMRALILVPTRELALQISDSISTYGRHLRLSHTVIIGGVSQRPQVKAMSRGVDVLIATPGRLLDLIDQRRVDPAWCDYLILDEADRMFDMGFIRDVRRIVGMLPQDRQTLLFSATMPAEIARLAGEILFEPERIEIAARTVAVERIEQYVHHLSGREKTGRLADLLAAPDLAKVIVFTRTKRGADRVVKSLAAGGVSAEAMHGNKTQSARQKALEKFRSGRARVLVATDIAARGLDVDNVSHVINYDLPHEPESYVHRIGRTARAGAEGIAISFCDPSERAQLRAIERLIKRPLDLVGEAPVGPDEKPAGRGAGRGGGGRGQARQAGNRNGGEKAANNDNATRPRRRKRRVRRPERRAA